MARPQAGGEPEVERVGTQGRLLSLPQEHGQVRPGPTGLVNWRLANLIQAKQLDWTSHKLSSPLGSILNEE